MKSETAFRLTPEEACSPGVLTASTLPSLEGNLEAPGRLSLTTVTLEPAGGRSACAEAHTAPTHRPRPLRLTDRREAVIDLIFRLRALRDDQVQTALYTPGGASRCRRDLTLLVRHRYLDRLPRQRVNDPAIYVLTRRSIAGNRLMREQWGEETFRRHMIRLGPIDHLLAVNDVRVRIERACRDRGWSLLVWQRPEELTSILAPIRLVPDGYFQIQRKVDGQVRTAGFFLEVERAGKSSRVLRSKLLRYGELYYGGHYQRLFGTQALRLLVVFVTGRVGTPSIDHRVESAVVEAERLGVTIARFVGLEQLTQAPPSAMLVDQIWRAPGLAIPVVLFQDVGER